jgi:sugar transferase (PEP-CTERM system associated)
VFVAHEESLSQFFSRDVRELKPGEIPSIPGRIESFERTAVQMPQRMPPAPVKPVPLVKKPSHRYVPDSALVLFLLDFVFLGAAQAGLFAGIGGRLDIRDPVQLWVLMFVSLAVHLSFLYAAGCFRRDTLVNFSTATSRLAVALGFSAFVLMGIMHFGLNTLFPDAIIFRSVSRSATIAFLGMGVSLCAGLYSRVLFFAMARRHWFRRRILIIGTGMRAQYLNALLTSDSHRQLAEVAFVPETVFGGASKVPAAALQDSIATSTSIEALASEFAVDEVVVAVDDQRGLALERLLAWKTNGIPVFDFNTFIERETGRVDLRWLELSYLLFSSGFQIRLMDAILKRAMDIAISAMMLIVALPVLVIASIAIVLEDFGPIFYRQTRVTQGGRVFWIYKLRTMRTDAEKMGAKWADQNDPRITRVGSILRRTRVDEIPQLFNVLIGDMSLVGPRPERPVFVDELSQSIRIYSLRHNVKSGLTGWAQINYPYGASKEDAERKLEYDLYYMKNYSLLRDFSIMLQTFRVLVWPQGVR